MQLQILANNKHIIEEEMKRIGISYLGLKIVTPKTNLYAIKVKEIDNRAAAILKQEMLSAGGDVAIPEFVSAFKMGKCDVIIIGTEVQYKVLAQKLIVQPFDLKELAAKIEDSFKGKPLLLSWKKYKLSLKNNKYVMGIVNLSPDSFYDGGRYSTLDDVKEHVEQMVKDGVDIIDVGAESTRPGTKSISLEDEKKRLIPVLKMISKMTKKPISVDTYKPEVAQMAINNGATIINDVTGLKNKRMISLIAKHNIPVVIMHMRGTPSTMQQNTEYKDIMSEIVEFFRERIEFAVKNGIKEDKIIIDPGIGFGKSIEGNFLIIKRLEELKTLKKPVLIGLSRKSFIGKVLNLDIEQRLSGTIAMNMISLLNGADIIRVHDVKEAVEQKKLLHKYYRVMQ